MAAYLNVSLNTIQAWEQGVRSPGHAALRLLEIIDKGPKYLASMIGTEHKGNRVNALNIREREDRDLEANRK